MRFRLLLLLPFFLACTQKEKVSQGPLGYLPENPALVLKINHLNNLKTELKNISFFQEVGDIETFKNLVSKLEDIDQFDPIDLALVGFYEVGKNNFEFVIAAKSLRGLENLDDVENRAIETITYEDKTIQKITLDDKAYFLIVIDDVNLIASSQLLIENLIRSEVPVSTSKALKQLHETSGINKSATIFLNLDESSALTNQILNSNRNIAVQNFGSWLALDVSNQQNGLHLSGVTVAQDSVKSFLNLFRGTLPSSESIAAITPRNADGLLSFRFGDFNTFAQNKKEYLDVVQEPDTLLNTIDEVGFLAVGNSTSIALKSFGPNNLIDFLLDNSSQTDAYQGYDIRAFNRPEFLIEQLNPIVKKFSANFYTLMENSFVFSENQEALKNIIANKNSGTTFDSTSAYLNAREFLPFESSIFFVSKKGGIATFLKDGLSEKMINELTAAKLNDFSIAGQVGVDGDIFHTQVILNKIGVQRTDENVSPLLTVEFDSDLAIDPQFVKNHRNNKYEVVVQDKDRNLYLIDSQGKILWKKQLDGIIRGKIHQVDLYRNGRLQMAFCTNNQFLVLDRNGEITKGISKKYEGGNLNGLSVFDYENNRKYRMVVTQGKKIFMYDNDGKSVDGFTFKEAESSIINPPKHFRISGKDYLVFQLENGQLKIRHRSGGDRIKVNRTIDFSDNTVFLYLNKFSTTDKKGVLHQVGTNGKLSATAFNQGSNHGIYATSKTLVLLDENILNIKGKKVELELGVYSKPKIFYIYDKIYVAVTDIQNQKIQLFDSQGKAIPNFPVIGSSAIDMIDIEGDGKLELVAKDQENSIILYGIN